MDKCRSRPRRPDKALYVPKARRNADEPPSGEDNYSEPPPASVSKSSIPKRPPENIKADSHSRVHVHRKKGRGNSTKSPVPKKDCGHKNDRDDVCIKTETAQNDSLCKGVNNLVVNEDTSIQNFKPTSRIVPSASAHAVFLSKKEEQFDVHSRSAIHTLGEQHENTTQGSVETTEERSRMTEKPLDQGTGQSRKTFSSDVSIEDPKQSKPIDVSMSIADHLAEGPLFTYQQEAQDLPTRSISLICEPKTDDIDTSTKKQEVLFSSTDCTEIITSDIKDPSGQFTICTSNTDNAANIFLCENQESIAGRKLDSTAAETEPVSGLAEMDNIAIVFVMEPLVRATDEHIADVNANLSKNGKCELNGLQSSESSGNCNTTHTRLKSFTQNASDDEVPSEHSSSYCSQVAIQQNDTVHVTESGETTDNHMLDKQFMQSLPVMVGIDPNHCAANAVEFPDVASIEDDVISRNKPSLNGEQMPLAPAEQDFPTEIVMLGVGLSKPLAEQVAFEEHVQSFSKSTKGDGDSTSAQNVESDGGSANSRKLLKCSDKIKENTSTGMGLKLDKSKRTQKDDFIGSRSVITKETSENVAASVAYNDEEESWDSLFNDDGECVDPRLLVEVILCWNYVLMFIAFWTKNVCVHERKYCKNPKI